MPGPLHGVRIVELPAIGPVPFGGMVLGGLGADIVRVERPGTAPLLGRDARSQVTGRDRRSVALDLKDELAVEAVLRLVERADAVLEGWRPGVAERLGVGPDTCLARNPRLVYGRMTGWGQEGPLSATAGHDIGYIALSGVLNAIGRAGEPPLPPINILGDYAGGGMLLALGVVSAVLEARSSGAGQVVDAAMVDGAALLGAGFFGHYASGDWSLERGTNLVDTGAPFYDVYETADGRWLAVGALEPQFYRELVELLGLDPATLPDRSDRSAWPRLREAFGERFRSRTQEEWREVFEGSDACVAPVLTFEDAPRHPHNVARGTFVEVDGVVQPAPAPRFSRTPVEVRRPPVAAGTDTAEVLAELGFDGAERERLLAPQRGA